MNLIPHPKCLLTLASLVALASPLQAQYSIDWWTIGAGGITGDESLAVEYTLGHIDPARLETGAVLIEGGYFAGQDQPVRLEIEPAETGLRLSWKAGGYVLEAADELDGEWIEIGPGVTPDGEHYSAPFAGNQTQRFFRLRRGQCADFQTLMPQVFTTNRVLGVDLYDHDSRPDMYPEVRTVSGATGTVTGIYCDHQLDLKIPNTLCSEVTLLLASSAQPATIVAADPSQATVVTATMTQSGRLQPEVVVLRGKRIDAVHIYSPAAETYLLEVCYKP